MIPKGLFSQIVVVIVSVALIFTYIQPTLAEIEEKQDDIVVYEKEKDSVESVNNQLAGLIADLDSVSQSDRDRLFTYLPTNIDDIEIIRHLLLISEQAQVAYIDASYTGDGEGRESSRNGGSDSGEAIPHTFELQVEGTYQQIKQLLRLIELNEYPLEVHNMNISQANGPFLSANLTLVTYQYNSDVVNSN